MQKKYKKILFDLGNTLVNDDENRKYAIKQMILGDFRDTFQIHQSLKRKSRTIPKIE